MSNPLSRWAGSGRWGPLHGLSRGRLAVLTRFPLWPKQLRCLRRYYGIPAARFPRWSTRWWSSATVTDGDVAFHRGQCLLIEHLADQTQVLLNTRTLRPVGYGDARRLLPPVLQGIQAVIG